MTINQLIKVLKQAKKDFGDVPVTLVNGETGQYVPIMEATKLHPHTGQYGCINRSEPVNGISLQEWSSVPKSGYGVRSDIALWPTSKD